MLMAPPVPAGTTAALAVISPSQAFSVETTGCGWPVGHTVIQPRYLPMGTAVMFREYATAVAGMPQLAVAIAVVIVINGVFAFVQEHRAQRAAERLNELLPKRSMVIRDGERLDVAATDLVGGDRVVLRPGDLLSADLVIDQADALLKVYAASTDAEVKRTAQDLAGDRFIASGTWKWIEMQLKTGKSPVFRYRFDQTLPLAEPAAPHASEIEYVFQVLSSRRLPWRPEDRKVSDLMGSYWTNFAKTGNPNGPDLPPWPAYASRDGYQVMHLTADPRPAPDQHRARYEFLDKTK